MVFSGVKFVDEKGAVVLTAGRVQAPCTVSSEMALTENQKLVGVKSRADSGTHVNLQFVVASTTLED